MSRKRTSDRNEKVFMGAWVERGLKRELRRVARAQKRSMNAQLEIFLAAGVEHLRHKVAS